MKKAQELRQEAERLQEQANLLEAYEQLQTASQHEYRARRVVDFGDWLGDETVDAISVMKRRIAIRLGHEERAAALVACGMEPERANLGDLCTDEYAASTLATWLFDSFGRYRDWHGIYQNCEDERARYSAAHDKCAEHFPLGWEFWKKGRHDT
jgi:hypothetical protein